MNHKSHPAIVDETNISVYPEPFCRDSSVYPVGYLETVWDVSGNKLRCAWKQSEVYPKTI